MQGVNHQDTLGSIANLASTYIYQGYSSVGKQNMIISLTDRIRDNVRVIEEDIIQVTRSLGREMITLLLDLKRDNVPVTKYVVKAAAGNESSGKEVMEILFTQRGDEVEITEAVVSAAAGNERSGKEVMTLLLD